MTAAALTLASFLLRGVWMLTHSPLLLRRATRVVPHLIDSVLFITGLALAMGWHGAFYREPWLMTKLAAVLLYIMLGMVALRSGRPQPVRATAFVAALSVFAWIVSMARTRSIVPF